MPGNGATVAIAPEEVHHLDLDLAAGDFVRLRVEQQGVDVAIRLSDPAGGEVVRVDSPTDDQGVEELVAVAGVAGTYRFEVIAPAGVAPGHYRLLAPEVRSATAADRELVAADRLFLRARKLLKAGRAGEALAGFRSALDTFERLALPARQADALREISLAYQALGEAELAALLVERAAALYRELGDDLQLAVALVNAGWLRLLVGQAERAWQPLTEAAAVYERLGRRSGVARATGFLGSADFQLGRVQSALTRFERAIALAHELGDEGVEAVALYDLGSVLLALHQPREALAGYERAREIFARGGRQGSVGVALVGIARAALQLGELGRADEALAQALPLLSAPARRHDKAGALLTLGYLRRQQGDYTAGRAALEQALGLAREAGDRQAEAVARLELGHLETLTGDPVRGLELHELAQAGFAALDDPAGEASARVRGAQALAAMGRLSEARERLGLALATIETLRAETVRRDYRTSYFAFRQDYYEIAIGVLMALHRAEPEAGHHLEAFRVNERRLARELVDELTDRSGAPGSAEEADAAPTAEERRLEDELSTLASRPAALGADTERAISDRLAELAAVRGEQRAERLAGPTPPQPELVDAGQARALLDPGTALMVYALGDDQSFLWLLDAAGVEAVTLPGRSEIEPLARGFARLALERHGGTEGPRKRRGEQLTRKLFAQVGGRIAGRRLVIVADGELQRVPFAALPVPGDSGRYLIEEHEIVLLPSVSTLFALRRAAPRSSAAGGLRIAAFADPVYSAGDPRLAAADGGDGEVAVAAAESGSTGAGPKAGDDAAADAEGGPSATGPDVGAPAVAKAGSALESVGPNAAAAGFAHDPASEGGLVEVTRGHSPGGSGKPAVAVFSDAELTRAAGALGVDPFERLVNSGAEAEGILALAPGDGHRLATGLAADREALEAGDLAGFGVLHFATHALVHPDHPELSGLVLSLVGPDSRRRDGFLRAYEISRLDLPAELVTLSACESGVGQDLPGEGMASLARSFFHAGARRVVATLWRVSDRPTATLMVDFYRRLLTGGEPPAAALRSAQLQAMTDPATRQPYYWAGFTFQGDWREVGAGPADRGGGPDEPEPTQTIMRRLR